MAAIVSNTAHPHASVPTVHSGGGGGGPSMGGNGGGEGGGVLGGGGEGSGGFGAGGGGRKRTVATVNAAGDVHVLAALNDNQRYTITIPSDCSLAKAAPFAVSNTIAGVAIDLALLAVLAMAVAKEWAASSAARNALRILRVRDLFADEDAVCSLIDQAGPLTTFFLSVYDSWEHLVCSALGYDFKLPSLLTRRSASEHVTLLPARALVPLFAARAKPI